MNGLRPEEIVLIQGRPHPTVGGRLRLAHEGNEKLTINTTLVQVELGVQAVVRAVVITAKGTFEATAVATAERDPKLVDALVELAETRSVSRALRWANLCGFEVGVEEVAGEAHEIPAPLVAPSGRPESRGRGGRTTALPPTRRTPKGAPASSAQLRCIETLARRSHQDPGTLIGRVVPGADLGSLTLTEASQVIDELKHEGGAANEGAGR